VWGVVVGIQTVEQAWREALHVDSLLRAVLKRKMRHYSLVLKSKVVACQHTDLVEEAVKLDVLNQQSLRSARHRPVACIYDHRDDTESPIIQ
jgi:hypothetical protein